MLKIPSSLLADRQGFLKSESVKGLQGVWLAGACCPDGQRGGDRVVS